MKKMENKQALSELYYEAPRVEVLEVEVEKGFATSYGGESELESFG